MFTVTVTWNGTTITGPVLIFQDELVRDDRTNVLATPIRDGTVRCRSENQAQVGWHFASGALISPTSTTNHFRQRRTATSAIPSVSRLTTNRPDEALTSAAANGLWTCRLNGSFTGAVPVGIYTRGGGEKGALIACLFLWGYMPEEHCYCRSNGKNAESILQVVVLSLPTMSPSIPPHFCPIPQPSLCMVQPVEDRPKLTLGQEMVKSSLTMLHTAPPYK